MLPRQRERRVILGQYRVELGSIAPEGARALCRIASRKGFGMPANVKGVCRRPDVFSSRRLPSAWRFVTGSDVHHALTRPAVSQRHGGTDAPEHMAAAVAYGRRVRRRKRCAAITF